MAEEQVLAEAQATALKLSKLMMKAHLGCKLLAREQLLRDLDAAMALDRETYKAMLRIK